MNRSDLISMVAQSADISRALADRALRSFEKAVADALSKGDDVRLVGFGRFSSVKRAARQYRNPQTGQKMKIEARIVAKFKPGKRLCEAVDQ